jgi:large subunit ribosomal protein L33
MSQDKLIKLACEKCKKINYWSSRRKKGDGIEKINVNKYCKWCKAHTLHKELKK